MGVTYHFGYPNMQRIVAIDEAVNNAQNGEKYQVNSMLLTICNLRIVFIDLAFLPMQNLKLSLLSAKTASIRLFELGWNSK